MPILKAIFLDIGGVLMTNGWDHALRQKVASKFGIEYEEMDSRHKLVFDTYETGKLTFDEYLEMTIFYKKRPCAMEEVKTFIFEAVRPFEDMIRYIKEIKKAYSLKIGVVSNEGRELAEDRIRRFNLPSFVDFFIISSFVHFRKPDLDIYRLAIDVAQVPAENIAYIEDRLLLVEVARTLGIQSIQHKDLPTTKSKLDELLKVPASS